MRKLFTLILALAVSAGTMFAAIVIDGIAYNLNDETFTAAVSGGACTGEVVIPSSITYNQQVYSVTSIGDYAFDYCTGLTSVTIPNSVTSIGNGAFEYCSGLSSVTIPNSVTSIGGYAFRGCTGLTSVTIPNSVTSIGNGAFYNCSGLTSPVYNAHVFAYMPTSYSGSYSISDDIESIAGGAFYGCTGLTNVTIPSSVTSIGDEAFSGCTGLSSVTIPNSVTSIGGWAFRDCTGLTSVTIPNSVTSIGDRAFENCSSLTSVTIPNSVTSIGNLAFGNCSGLTSITIPNSVTSIGYAAFSNVPNIVYSGEATGSPWGARSRNGYVDGWLVYSDNTKTNLLACSSAATGTIEIPNSVTSIGYAAFSDCTGLTSVTIPNSVTSIGMFAFSGCTGLTSITIPNSVTSIRERAFYGCKGLTSVTIPNSVTSIGNSAFWDCTGLTSVTIPNSVTSIGIDAFSGCTGLTSIEIPNSVTSIGIGAFYGCTGLTTITCEAMTPPSLGSSAFENVDKSKCTLYVPLESIGAYQAADQWKEFLDILPLPGTEGTTGEDCSNAIPFDWEQGTVNPKGARTWYAIHMDEKLFQENKDLRFHVVNLSETDFADVSISLYYRCGDPEQGMLLKTIAAGDTLSSPFLNIFALNKWEQVLMDFHSTQATHVWIEKIDYKRDTLYGDTTFFVCKGDEVKGRIIHQDTVWNDTISNIKDEENLRIVESIYTVNVFVLRDPQGYDFSDQLKDIHRGEQLDLTAADTWLKAQYGAADNDTIQTLESIKWQYAVYPDYYTFKDVNLDNQPTLTSERIKVKYIATTECGDQIESMYINTARDTIRVEACNSYRWDVNDSLYVESTLDSVKVADGQGIWGDSIVYLNLRINHCGIPVIFLDDNDHVLSEQNVDLHLPAAPIISGKSFKGWLTESADSQNGIVFRATYTTDNPTTYDDVNITPYSNSAAVIFPFITGALSYQLVIRDLLGNVVCKIMFSASGHLMGVVFAPNRNRAQQHATETTGFNFTVEGLDANTTYVYEFVANDETDEVIETLSGSFTTKAESSTEDNEQVNSPSAIRKYLEGGHLMINNNANSFDAQGKMVR
jgi:hypothetical protein